MWLNDYFVKVDSAEICNALSWVSYW